MSDFDRNAATYDRAAGRATSAVIDQGLRSYMLQVYNYMVLGLAITGFAALGVYMLSVTGDAAAAAKVMRNGAEASGCDSRRAVPDADRLHHLRQPAEVGDHAVAAGAGLRAQLRHGADASGHVADAVLAVRGADGHLARLDLHGLYPDLDHPGVLHHRGDLRRAQPVGLHHAAGHLRLGLVPVHGPDRRDPGFAGEPDLAERHADTSWCRSSAC